MVNLTIEAFLLSLAAKNVKLSIVNDKLSVKGNLSALDGEVKGYLIGNKAEIITFIRSKQLTKIQPRRQTEENRIALSFAQQRLWLIEQIEEQNSQYNIALLVRLEGQLNQGALHNTFKTILDRHQILRTHYSADDQGNGVQIIELQPDLALPVVDLSALGGDQQQAKLDQLVNDESQKPFDLSADLMLRTGLIKLSDNGHMLMVTIHHIASDGWSMGILIKEMSALYSAYVEDKPSPLPQLAIQYADYASWQRQWLQGAVLQKQLDYWKSQLHGLPVEHSLPLDKPRLPFPSHTGAYVFLNLSPLLTRQINALAKSQDATLFMVIYAAFSCFLSRYSGESDIVLGSPIANREQVEISPLVGFFVNTLVLRLEVSPDMSFNEMLALSKKQLLGAYDNQQMPFEMLVDELQPQRSLRHSPLFQIMLSMEQNEHVELQLPQLTLSPLVNENIHAKFDLTLNIDEQESGLLLRWEYATDIFQPQTIEQMSALLQNLLQGIVANPAQKVSLLPLLSDQDRQQLLSLQSGTKEEYASDCCVHKLFEAQVAKTPDAIALVFEQQQLTYQVVNERANQLAHYLIERGVGANSCVAMCIDRSPEMVIAVMAILKAGGAYVPLDPIQPKNRLESILKESRSTLLLTCSTLLEDLPKDNIELVLVDELQSALSADYAVVNPELNLDAANSVYILFTSGSTGVPKGVDMPHRAVVNLFHNMHTKHPRLAAGLRTIQFASITFDMAFTDIFMTLTKGGKLYLIDKELQQNIPQLVEFSLQNEIEVLHLPYAALSLWMETVELQQLVLPAVQLVMSSAEQLKLTPAIRSFFQRHPHSMLVNEYGPSETHVVTSIEFDSLQDVPNVPSVGYGYSNAQLFVLDQHQALQPLNVAGELCVGGDSLAKGYLNRPDLTAEKFIDHPFDASSGAKVYRTSDLVRRRFDGTFEFVARMDNQVKIRGFRIELGEIEVNLAAIDSVKQSIVVALDSADGGKQLVAYVVQNSKPLDQLQAEEQSALSRSYRQFLAQNLPDYMVPHFIVLMASLPVNVNGKVDRRALPKPDLTVELKATYVEPENETQRQLCQMWQTLLNLEQVGISDNFFEIGGHSLLATRLVSLIRAKWQVDVPVRVIFERQTVAALAPVVQQSDISDIPLISKVDRDQRLPLSFAQQRLWLIDQIEPESTQYNMPAALKFSGKFNQADMQRALNSILQRHQILRTNYSVDEQDQQPHQIIKQDAQLSILLHDLADLTEAEQNQTVATLIQQEADKPFDLATDLMLRSELIRLGDDEHILLVTMHHIASDGWSMSILTKELSALYSAYVADQEDPLSELAIQYADYAHWQRNWLQGDVLDKQLSYWKDYLNGIPLVHNLPLDRPRTATPSHKAGTLLQQLDDKLLEQLNKLARTQGATLFMVLNAAFSCLLSRHSGESDIVVGSPIANREQLEVSPLVGFFINTLVLRTEVVMDERFIDLLAKSKTSLLQSYEHQQIPFEMLVDELHPGRSLSQTPIFQVMLVLQNYEQTELSLPGLTMSLTEQGHVQAKYELLLTVTESSAGLALSWEYATDLFDEVTISRMSGHFAVMLQGSIDNPAASISELPLLTATEKHQLLVDWNDTRADYPKNRCMHQLFEDQVEKTQDATALVFAEQNLSYRQLNEKSNQLANYLLEQGMAPDELVGLCVERSLVMVIGLLAIQKAGGAYVPLEPSYPLERKQRIIDKAEIKIVLVDQQNQQAVDCALLIEPAFDERYGRLNLNIEQDSQKVAYVIFTSGSTGEPKGVVIAHHSAVNLITLVNRNFNINSSDVILCITSVGFDLSVYDIFGALAIGAKLIISNSGDELEPNRLLKLIDKHQVTYWDSVPSTLKMVVDHLDIVKQQVVYNSLRLAFLSGDWIPTSLPAAALKYFPTLKVIGLGGATEGTVWSNSYPINEDTSHLKSVPYGRPLDNNTFYVLDDHLNPVPIGVVGKLHWGGVGVALEYLNDSEKTAAAYLPDPFHPDLNPTMYCTGDLGRIMADSDGNPGEMEFIGRIDNQVKVRGFRIELGEIQSCLLSHESVNSAIVIVKEQPEHVAAYVVVDAGFSSENGEIGEVLKNLARNSLPDYMVPAAIMQLDNIPLTANGKVDRKALPDSNFQSHSQDEYVAPETEVEQKLCAIWQQLLGLEQVGTVERFFEVGGQSLLATRLVSLIFAEFSVEVSIKELFYAQTVREQAGLVEEQLNMQLLLDDLDSLSESELDAQLKLLEQLDS